ncbi:hypothetical protein [Polyangium spumosum]|uniref:Uncharacterized protein n=1 Tax=Polyangium spumosum TaxID=889282 RepID=A0A6N7PH05_9BACT|nr:hypothetical protein [Polyangium spumosum]MRG91412.1 hypothetical protein [Polyangium spumosum]
MILECRHCGAPLDVKPDASLTKCRYCGVTSERRLLRTLAAVTPRDFRPPRQWVPPPHVPAPSNKPLSYHAGVSVFGALVAAFLVLVVGVTVVVNVRGRGVSGSGPFGASTSPNDLAAAQIDLPRASLAKALGGSSLGSSLLSVPLGHDRYQSVSFMFDEKEPAYPKSFSLVPRSGARADPRVSEALGRRLHGGLKDGNWNWAGLVSVSVDARSGTVAASVQRVLGPGRSPNPHAKAQLVALWKLVLGAVFDVPVEPSSDEARLLGAPHRFGSLATLDTTTTVDKAAETLTRRFPGAIAKTFIHLDVTIAVDHPLVREVALSFRNEEGGSMSTAHLRGTQAFPGRREAFATCLEGHLGKPEVSDRDYVNKKRDYRFTAGKAWLNVNEDAAFVNGHGHRIQAADWGRIVHAVDACR